MQKTKGNLTFSEKYKLVQWLEQNLANLSGRKYDDIAAEATDAMGFYVSSGVLEGINRDDELTVKWKTSRTGAEPQVPNEQLFEEYKKLSQRVFHLESRLDDLLSVMKQRPPLLPLSPLYTEPYKVDRGDPTISQIFKGNEGARSIQDNAVAGA